MKPTDYDHFDSLLTSLGEVTGEVLSKGRIKAYRLALDRFTIEQLEFAINRAVQTAKFFPKPVEIAEAIEGSLDDRASRAWAAFLEAAGCGGMHSVQFLEPACAVAVDAVFGGWVQACRMLDSQCSDEMVASYEKQFRRQFIAALNSGRPVDQYRAGLSEMSLREGGGDWLETRPVLVQPMLFVGREGVRRLNLPFDVAQGQLSGEAKACLASGWQVIAEFAKPYQPQLKPAIEQKLLPASTSEIPSPEEQRELIRQMRTALAARKPMPTVTQKEVNAEPENVFGV